MREFWDKFWQGLTDTLTEKDILYLADEIKLEYTLHLLQTMQGRISTIEVGSGSGRLSCFLASAGYLTTCLDCSPNALRVASNNYCLMELEGNFIMAEAESLPFRSNSFDVVLSTGLLEHFADPQPIVNEMARILKPGGCFISDIVPKKLLVPYKFRSYVTAIVSGTLLRLIRQRKSNSLEYYYERRVTKRDIKCWLRSAGLQDINVFAAGVLPPPLDPPMLIPFAKQAERVYNKFVYFSKPILKRMDKTAVAELFGLYYYVHAKKPE